MTTQIIPTNNKEEAKAKIWRIKKSIKFTVIILSILALSLFFEGWRQIKTGITAGHLAILISGILSTIVLLWVQAFWIYVEEKAKGNLKKKVVHFDRLEKYLQEKRGQAAK